MRSKRPFQYSLVVSICIHVLVVFCLIHAKPKAVIVEEPNPHEWIFAEIETRKGTPHTGAKKYVRPSLRNLGLGLSANPSRKNIDSSYHFEDADTTSQGVDMETEGQMLPFFLAVWDRINSNLTYPKDFVEKRNKGFVRVQLSLNRDGTIAYADPWIVNSDDPLLKTLVIASMIYSLKQPLKSSLWLKQEKMRIANQFEFDLIGHGYAMREVETRTIKNTLNFSRRAFVEPKLNQELQRIITRIIPPIIPLPGGFYIDFIGMYHYIDNIGRPDPRDLRNERMQMEKEKLELFIEEKK